MTNADGSQEKRGSNRAAFLVIAAIVLGGTFVIAQMAGPENPNAKQCSDTEFEHNETARVDPLYSSERMRHLAWDFVSCQKGCDKEQVANSCTTVAVIYREGKGLRYEGGVDLDKAAEYASRACEIRGDKECAGAKHYRCLADESACDARCHEGDAADCVSLTKGIDVPGGTKYDPVRAMELHGLACKAGVEESCGKERLLLCASRPVDCADRCKAGEAPLCYQLGELYERGQGDVPKDPSKGITFRRKGCELDASVDAQCTKILNDAKIDL
jgi:TPR repeat protein